MPQFFIVAEAWAGLEAAKQSEPIISKKDKMITAIYLSQPVHLWLMQQLQY